MFVNRNPEYFLMIARERNITRAAEKLFVTQSSLSQYLAKLEAELGVQLFDRAKSPIALTEAGQIYQRYLESSSYLYQKLLTDLNGDRMQNVDIGIGNWRGSILLPKILPEFLAAHPDVQFHLHEYPVSELPSQVEDGKVDFAVMNISPAWTSGVIVNRVFANERILLVMHRDLPLAGEYLACAQENTPIDLMRLEQLRYIALDSRLTVGRHIRNFLKQQNLVFPDSLSTTDNRTALRLTAEKLGFCFMIETGLQDGLESDLIAFDLGIPELLLPLSFLYRQNAYRSPAVQAFMDTICDYYASVIGHAGAVRLRV